MESYSVMESLNDFFQDCEKEYSQQVTIPESEVIKESWIKTRKLSFNTEKLKQNVKERAAKAKKYKAKLSKEDFEIRKSSKGSSKKRGSSSLKSKETVPVKSDEFTLRGTNNMIIAIEKYKKNVSKQPKENKAKKWSFNTTRNKIMAKI